RSCRAAKQQRRNKKVPEQRFLGTLLVSTGRATPQQLATTTFAARISTASTPPTWHATPWHSRHTGHSAPTAPQQTTQPTPHAPTHRTPHASHATPPHPFHHPLHLFQLLDPATVF